MDIFLNFLVNKSLYIHNIIIFSVKKIHVTLIFIRKYFSCEVLISNTSCL